MSNSMKSVFFTALACLVISANSFACGESLFRVGKGLNYREYTAPLPGNILVVARTEGELAMVERLSAAGHNVQVIQEPEELGDALGQDNYDIVLAPFSQRDTVETQIASESFTGAYLPVTLEATGEQSVAEGMYGHSLSTDDSVKRFLKTIHQVLKQRQA